MLLGDLPPELGRLTALTRLDLANSKVMGLPEGISQLTALRELDLTDAPMEFIFTGPHPGPLPRGLTACRQLSWLAVEARHNGSLVRHELPSLNVLKIGRGDPTRFRRWLSTNYTCVPDGCLGSTPKKNRTALSTR